MDGVVVLDQRALHVQFDVYRPGGAGIHHLLVGDAVQLALRQRSPGPELTVLLAELLDALHLVVAQLVASLEECLHLVGDALLLGHLRHGLAWRHRLVDGAEYLAQLLGIDVPCGERLGAHDRRLLGQARATAELCQPHHQPFLAQRIVRLRRHLVEGTTQADVVVAPFALDIFPAETARRPALLVGIGLGAVLRRRLLHLDDGQRLGILVIIGVRVLAQPTASGDALFLQRYLVVAEGRVVLCRLLLGSAEKLGVVVLVAG